MAQKKNKPVYVEPAAYFTKEMLAAAKKTVAAKKKAEAAKKTAKK